MFLLLGSSFIAWCQFIYIVKRVRRSCNAMAPKKRDSRPKCCAVLWFRFWACSVRRAHCKTIRFVCLILVCHVLMQRSGGQIGAVGRFETVRCRRDSLFQANGTRRRHCNSYMVDLCASCRIAIQEEVQVRSIRQALIFVRFSR